MINVTVWSEFRHEKTDGDTRKIYPEGLHAVIGAALSECDDIRVTLAALDDEYQGLPDAVLDSTDVLFWWGHMAHEEVKDELVEKIRKRVISGMGLVVLHSGHHSKIFRSVIGDSGNLVWGDEQREIVWNINPTHPITRGVPTHFVLPREELYSEPFCIAPPDEELFISWFENGYVFRSGNIWYRGRGKVFYFQPGHEKVPTYYDPTVRRILKNAAHYCAPAAPAYAARPWGDCPCVRGSKADEGEIPGFEK